MQRGETACRFFFCFDCSAVSVFSSTISVWSLAGGKPVLDCLYFSGRDMQEQAGRRQRGWKGCLACLLLLNLYRAPGAYPQPVRCCKTQLARLLIHLYSICMGLQVLIINQHEAGRSGGLDSLSSTRMGASCLSLTSTRLEDLAGSIAYSQTVGDARCVS